MVKEKTCGSCARGDCALAGHVENCLDWCNDEDAPTAPEITTDLAPLTRAECAARGIRHSSEDDHRLFPFETLFASDFRIEMEAVLNANCE